MDILLDNLLLFYRFYFFFGFYFFSFCVLTSCIVTWSCSAFALIPRKSHRFVMIFIIRQNEEFLQLTERSNLYTVNV